MKHAVFISCLVIGMAQLALSLITLFDIPNVIPSAALYWMFAKAPIHWRGNTLSLYGIINLFCGAINFGSGYAYFINQEELNTKLFSVIVILSAIISGWLLIYGLSNQ